jgi:hypothetical protein
LDEQFIGSVAFGAKLRRRVTEVDVFQRAMAAIVERNLGQRKKKARGA